MFESASKDSNLRIIDFGITKKIPNNKMKIS